MGAFLETYAPIVYALTGNKFLAGLTTQARTTGDIYQIITGTSPLISKGVREAVGQKRLAAKSTAGVRTSSKAIEDVVPGFPDSDLNDLWESGTDAATSFLGGDKVGPIIQAIIALVGMWQLKDAFNVGEGEMQFGETQEREYLNQITALSAEIGQLYESAKSSISNTENLTDAAKALYQRSMGQVRAQASASKDELTMRLAGMGASSSTIASALRRLDDQVLSQSAISHQNAEIFDNQWRESTRNYMSSLMSMQASLNQNRWNVAQTHFQMGMAEVESLTGMITSMIHDAFRPPDVTNVTQNNTTGGGEEGGGINDWIDTAISVAGLFKKAPTAATKPAGRQIESIVVDESGNATVEKFSPQAAQGQQKIAGLPQGAPPLTGQPSGLNQPMNQPTGAALATMTPGAGNAFATAARAGG